MKETKCHRFWLNNLNPITMKKDDNELSKANLSKEQNVALEVWRDNKRSRNNFNFNNQ
jgi:hypothetical protein